MPLVVVDLFPLDALASIPLLEREEDLLKVDEMVVDLAVVVEAGEIEEAGEGE
jgi:hypothetical protein